MGHGGIKLDDAVADASLKVLYHTLAVMVYIFVFCRSNLVGSDKPRQLKDAGLV